MATVQTVITSKRADRVLVDPPAADDRAGAVDAAPSVPLPGAPAGSGRRRWVGMALHLLALGLVVRFLVLPEVGSSDHSLAILLGVDRGWLAVALVAEAASLVGAVLTTYTVLPTRVRPSLATVARIDLSAIALGHVVPDGGLAGTALSWRLLVTRGVPSAVALGAKVAQGTSSTVVLQLLVLVGLLVSALLDRLSAWSLVTAVASCAILAVVAGAVAALRLPRPRRVIRALALRVPRVGPALADGVDGLETSTVLTHLREILASRTRSGRLAAYASANWVLDAVALWAGLRAYGAHVGLGLLVTVYALQVLGSWLPITPGGLGVAESMMIPALVAGGVGASAAAFGILAWRLAAYWLPIPVGAVAYLWLVLDPVARPGRRGRAHASP